MSADSFRFIHATNLRLDQPLTGAGALSADDRSIVEDATLTAFTRIVDACLQNDVDFLLLTGDCFEFQNGTLRGRLQMQRGLERLAERDISVFIIPGSLDPPASWKRGLNLPRNATLFTSEEDDAVEVTVNGQVVACVAPVAMASSDEAHWSANGPGLWRTDTDVFRIGLVGAGSAIRWDGSNCEPSDAPGASGAAAALVGHAIEEGVNYLALGEGAVRHSVDLASGIAHDPGSPQGLQASESGAKGCSLIEVDADGGIEVKFVPTAAVRWMSLAADAPSQVDVIQLAERMALVVMESEPHPTDDLWLIRWNLRASGDWTSVLNSSRSQSELWEKLERELKSIGGPARRHSLELTARHSLERDATGESGRGDIFEEFCESIDADAEAALELIRQDVLSPDWGQGAWTRHVRQALQRARISDISRRARDLGESWLS